MTQFSVVVPTLGRQEQLRDALAMLHSCEPSPAEILVVDGDPESCSAAVIESFAAGRRMSSGPPLRHIPAALGLTRQRNAGIDAASSDVLVFMDDDVVLPTDVFAALDDAYRDRGVVGVTGRVVEPGTRVGGPDSWLRRILFRNTAVGQFTAFGYPRYVTVAERELDTEVMPGCFMSVRREVAARVRFDESMAGYALGEDEDFAYRLSRIGRIRYRPDIVVEHRKLGFAGHDQRAFNQMVVANRAYLFRKNFTQTPEARLRFWLLIAVLLAHRVVNREWRGALGLIEGGWRVWRR